MLQQKLTIVPVTLQPDNKIPFSSPAPTTTHIGCQHRFKNVVFHRFKKCRFSAVRRCCFSPASAEKQRGTVFFHRSITEDRPVFFSWNAARVPACSLSCDMSFR